MQLNLGLGPLCCLLPKHSNSGPFWVLFGGIAQTYQGLKGETNFYDTRIATRSGNAGLFPVGAVLTQLRAGNKTVQVAISLVAYNAHCMA